MSETKTKIVMFCPDCLQKMRNGSNPSVFMHEVETDACDVVAVEVKDDRINKIIYNGDDVKNWALVCPS